MVLRTTPSIKTITRVTSFTRFTWIVTTGNGGDGGGGDGGGGGGGGGDGSMPPNSKAPMSAAPLRPKPRWSLGGALGLRPRLIAGLPACRAWVWVGPPLKARGTSI